MRLGLRDTVGRNNAAVLALLAAAVLGLSSTALGQPGKPSSPWKTDDLARPPAWEFLERPGAEAAKAIFFKGPSYQGRPTRVFAWLGIPRTNVGEKVPGMVLVHGGGGTAFDQWVRLWVNRGYAAIALDTCGQIPVGSYGHWVLDTDGGPHGWGGFDQIDQAREDQWTYQAVAKVILAHSLLRSLPQVDADRTGVSGISWGGYLTCIVAGVDARFKLAVPVYGCGFYDQTVFAGELAKLGPDRARQWLSVWDPSVYLRGAAIPILWVTGSNDFAYTLNALQRSYRLPGGPHTLCIRLRMPHGHGGAGENPEEIRVFADSILKAAPPLPRITDQGREQENVWATFATKVPLVKAELNFTRDDGPWQNRKGEAAAATIVGNRAAARLSQGSRVYYLNLTDGRGCLVSTEHEECASR
jgi:dienelactone hydrolase